MAEGVGYYRSGAIGREREERWVGLGYTGRRKGCGGNREVAEKWGFQRWENRGKGERGGLAGSDLRREGDSKVATAGKDRGEVWACLFWQVKAEGGDSRVVVVEDKQKQKPRQRLGKRRS